MAASSSIFNVIFLKAERPLGNNSDEWTVKTRSKTGSHRCQKESFEVATGAVQFKTWKFIKSQKEICVRVKFTYFWETVFKFLSVLFSYRERLNISLCLVAWDYLIINHTMTAETLLTLSRDQTYSERLALAINQLLYLINYLCPLTSLLDKHHHTFV